MQLATQTKADPTRINDKTKTKGLEFEFDDLFHGGVHPTTSEEHLINDIHADDNGINAKISAEKEEPLPVKDSKGNFVVNHDNQVTHGLKDYDIKYVLGQGGYGKVVLVEKHDTQELYAMKILKKDFLVKSNNVTYTRTERDILRKVRHPFIVSLHVAFQTEEKLYLVMDFLAGGQLLFHLRKETMFSEEIVKFYAAEVILALEHLHGLGMMHRDLKPENILLDSEGHIIVTDFGLAKENMCDENSRTKTFCGTIEYMAPEMIARAGYSKAADWWSVGILIYDMLTGAPPFQHKNSKTLQQKIFKDKIKLASYLTAEAHSLLRGFLNKDPAKRLGSGPNGVRDIKQHPWFKGIRWDRILAREITPPYRPDVKASGIDVSNFDDEYTKRVVLDSPHNIRLSRSKDALFAGFSYVRTPEHSRLAHGHGASDDDDDEDEDEEEDEEEENEAAEENPTTGGLEEQANDDDDDSHDKGEASAEPTVSQ